MIESGMGYFQFFQYFDLGGGLWIWDKLKDYFLGRVTFFQMIRAKKATRQMRQGLLKGSHAQLLFNVQ